MWKVFGSLCVKSFDPFVGLCLNPFWILFWPIYVLIICCELSMFKFVCGSMFGPGSVVGYLCLECVTKMS